MALYNNGNHLKQNTEWAGWNDKYRPADTVPNSGIYKCTGCKKEITSNKGDKFPPQNHHQHGTNQGSIQWQIIVYTDTQGEY